MKILKKTMAISFLIALASALFCVIITALLPNAKLPIINTIGIISLIILVSIITVYIIIAIINFLKNLNK